jgi:hypothetical protein
MMFGWWWAGAVIVIICMMLMGRMMMGHGHSGHDESHSESPGPERRLAERLASGEIDTTSTSGASRPLRRTDKPAHT